MVIVEEQKPSEKARGVFATCPMTSRGRSCVFPLALALGEAVDPLSTVLDEAVTIMSCFHIWGKMLRYYE